MDLENEKDSIEVMNAVLRNDLPIDNEKGVTTGNGKKNSKSKKKDSASPYGNEIAVIMRSSQTTDQKLATIAAKCCEQLHANRKLMQAVKMAEGKITKMQQENEQCQQQRSKAVLARSRLENLCRELQKLNKAQKEEIDLKLRLEEEKRKEISATFQSAFAEMNTLTSQNTEKNTKMREENLEMREKIKSVRERIELSEQQLEKVRQQAQLEVQLAEAKMAKLKMEMTAEKECLLKEKQQLLLKLTEYQVKIQELSATEVGLRSQISMYTEKYDDFQSALTKSNEVFSGFNEEMAKMSKKILKLEKETSQWKQRWEKSNGALLNMAADKQTKDAEMAKLNHKLSLLQELCKAFQRERTELLAQLRATTHRNEAGTDTEAIDKVNIKQVEELSKNCQDLKDNLVELQGSLAETIFESKTDDDAKVEKTGKTTPDNTEKIVEDNLKIDNIDDENKQDDSTVLPLQESDEKKNDEITEVTKDKVTDLDENEIDSSTLNAQINSIPSEEISKDEKTINVIDESIKLDKEINDNTNESVKNDDEGSECASFEVIDKTALDAAISSEQVDLAPASFSCDTTHVKNEKVDVPITTLQPDANSNIEKDVDSKEETSDDKNNSAESQSAKKTKDGKRKKKIFGLLKKN